ncbi:sacsin N-terminal ATP-binding-like domain-containing protein [Actinomadura craniellae]|uniref:sacsin N-terminal ATP-binding-like domain-containing protein n=1 Tax=Actinomadura craniellae TaxID=2231787 RepID=UPI001F1BF704|nr:hypothetical protein [Actinomadura craniellae]
MLRAWAESPARFREDANAEEDHALGGYRDRVIVELAQNAADAAAAAGVPGRLRLALRDGVLLAANTGAPLDAAGVAALSSLRASAKRGDAAAAGRFGVGFAAVVAVSDEPAIGTRSGTGVGWSARRTRELAAGLPSLAGELDHRGFHVPVLRLPFALPDPPRPGELGAEFETVVRLPLRDPAAADLVRRQLAETGPALLLALPALARVDVELDGAVRTLEAEPDAPSGTVVIDGVRWRTVEAHGEIPAELLADRPTEERARPYWRLRWALPDVPGRAAAVLHAPTPSDEPLDLPALLIASFPLAPDRRHVAPGPLTGFLVERAAEAYVELLRAVPPEPGLLDLVPGPVAAGELDARIRRAVLDRLPGVPLLPIAAPDGTSALFRGPDTVAVDAPAAAVDLLAGSVLPGLLPAGWPVRHPALAALGVRRLELADLVDALAGLERPPGWWHRLYEALAGARTDALGALPVPLADGRLVRGPRGLLVGTEGVDPADHDALGLRFVHPQAAHPLLARLGAVPAGPRAVLADPAVRAAVTGSYDAEEPEPIAHAVLDLVAAAGLDPGELPWLAELALPGDDGELYPAGELLLPDSPLRPVMGDDSPFGVVAADLVERHGADALVAAGVLRGFALVREHEVSVADLTDGAFDLDGGEEWAEDVLARLPGQDVPPLLPEFTAVRDLELVADWPAALALLAVPPVRAAVVEPAGVLTAGGRRAPVPSYTAWWLAREPVLAGRRPAELRFAAARELAGLYDVAPGGLDPEFLRALGVRASAAELLAEPGGAAELLARLADPDRTVSRDRLRELWTALTDRPPGADPLRPPERVRAVVDGAPEVVAAADALVLDRPDLLPLLAGQPLVLAAYDRSEELADALDLQLASDEVPGEVVSRGVERPVPPVVRAVLPDAPGTYVAHDPLVVDGVTAGWRAVGGTVHASGAEGLARGLAWVTGRWPDRLLVAAVLRDPGALPDLLAEADLDL